MKTLAYRCPLFTARKRLSLLSLACQPVERQMANQLIFNYYFVNDGSKDRTLDVLRQVSKQFENVHYPLFSPEFW